MHIAGEWRLELLGSFRLTHDSAPVRLPAHKSASLLAFLALHPGRHSREKLATLLWGDFPDQEARHSLRVALSQLRADLGDEAISADRTAVWLNPDFPLWTDALAFQSQADRSVPAPDTAAPGSFIELYRGDLMPDFDHEWIIPERERLRSVLLDALLSLADEHRTRGGYEEAICLARRVLTLDVSNERAHQHLMFCHMALGDRSAALQQYDTCRRALQDDLGVDPLPETTRLYDWIMGQPQHLASREARIGNLPVPLTSFVGRTEELAGCLTMLRRPDVRLLSLTGAGGSGKTRLGIEAANAVRSDYEHGVFFIDLAALQRADLLKSAIAQPIGVQAADKQPLSDALLDFLREKQILLVLDNFEQIIDAGPQLTEMLQVAPRLKLLVTSRAALRLTVEQEYPVLPLATPDLHHLPELPILSQFEAVALFIARSRAVRPDFEVTNANAPAVAAICVRLDGLPLAIELAAARSRLLPPQAMLSQLEHSLEFLVDGPRDLPARHRTLRASIDWSYALLSTEEKQLQRRLAVFAGGWTLEAAQAVCGGDTVNALASLVEASLVRRSAQSSVSEDATRHADPRFALLETIREYAYQRLHESGEAETVMAAHARFFLAWAEQLEPLLRGPQQKQWLDDVENEHDNVRAALQWAIERGDADTGLRLATALSVFWTRRYHWQEASALFNRLLALPGAAAPTALRARALTCAAKAAAANLESERAARLAEEAVTVSRDLDDQSTLAAAMHTLAGCSPMPLDRRRSLLLGSLTLLKGSSDVWLRSDVLGELGHMAWAEDNDPNAARTLLDEGLLCARASGDTYKVAMLLTGLTVLGDVCGDRSLMSATGHEALALAIELRDRAMRMFALGALAPGEQASEAVRMMDEGLAIAREIGDRVAIARYLSWAAESRMFGGDCEGAEPLVREVLAYSRLIGSGDQEAVARSLLDAGTLSCLRGRAEEALPLLRDSLAISLPRSGAGNTRRTFYTILWFAVQAALAGQWRRAARLVGAVDAHLSATGNLNPGMRAPLENSRTMALQRLGEEEFARAWTEGRGMTIHQAGEYAMYDGDDATRR